MKTTPIRRHRPGRWFTTMMVLSMAMASVRAVEGQGEAKPEEASMAERVASAPAQKFDEEFLKHMILHHIASMKMSELARFHSQNEELKTEVDQMRNKQQEQMAQMLDWLSLRYNEQPKPLSADDPLKKNLDRRMDELRTFNGAEFDRKFTEAITEHCERAVELSRLGALRAEKDDVRDLAQRIQQHQTEEIEKLRKLEKAADEKPDPPPIETSRSVPPKP